MEYQETMNVDIENMASKKQPIWRPVYEVIDYSYFRVTTLFPTTYSNQFRNNSNKLQNVPSKVK